MVDKHVYESPTCSYLYYSVVSPFCGWIIDTFVPKNVSPDLITLLGFACASSSAAACVWGNAALSGFLWQCYAICDNCDGKQARATGSSSAGGEFFDHAIDSCVSPLASIVLVLSLLNVSTQTGADCYTSTIHVGIMMISVFPYFIGVWNQHITGKMVFGISRYANDTKQPDYITVDEYNLIIIPVTAYMRALCPNFLDSSNVAWVLPSLIQRCVSTLLRVPVGSLTNGMLLYFVALVLGCLFGCRYMLFLFRPNGRLVCIPIVIWAVTSIYYRLNPVVMCCIFSLIAMEVMVKRLRIHVGSRVNIFYPLLLLPVFIGNPERLFGTGTNVSLDLTPSEDSLFTVSRDFKHCESRSLVLVLLLTAGSMWGYKQMVHQRYAETNTGWLLNAETHAETEKKIE